MAKSLLELIGNTPIIQIDNIYLKLEYFNPSGSIKDRMSLKMIEKYEELGLLHRGSMIVEATSGNTGIAVGMIAAIKGYKAVIIMRDNVNIERIKTIRQYGAKVLLVNKDCDIDEVGRRISKKCGAIFLDQHNNENNYLGYEKMAEEIINEIDEIDYLVCGMGTGGTIYGLARVLKHHYPNLQVIGVLPKNPKDSVMYGINSTIEEIKFDLSLVDEIKYVDDYDAIKMKNEYCLKGISVGNSSGASLYVASLLDKNKKILVIIPDNNFKYLSID